MYNPLDLARKRILVTGASAPIGRAIAVVLSRLGATLTISGRREEALRETRDLLEGEVDHTVEPFDLADVDGMPAWFRRLTAGPMPLDAVVHAAGVSTAIPIKVLNRARIDGVMLPNVYASLGLLRGVSGRGVAADGCSIVFISSVSGVSGALGHTTYSASKGALHALVRSAAKELGPKRMRVNCIAPAWVEGPIMDVVNDIRGDDFQDITARQFLGAIRPEDLGVAAAYLVSDAARTVTGTTMVVDGGWTC
jgi:NAD(P)-dependent dehydrogenase (short-subunit alcohol dehydrogenase family)